MIPEMTLKIQTVPTTHNLYQDVTTLAYWVAFIIKVGNNCNTRMNTPDAVSDNAVPVHINVYKMLQYGTINLHKDDYWHIKFL